jgi:hypothetical protein
MACTTAVLAFWNRFATAAVHSDKQHGRLYVVRQWIETNSELHPMPQAVIWSCTLIPAQ